MQFSDDELRAALRRKDPGESFTDRVMAQVTQPQARVTAVPNRRTRLRELWNRLRRQPVLASAIAVILLVAGSWGFVQYRSVQERRAGEAAKQQALLALRIANAKLNHVCERVKPLQAQ